MGEESERYMNVPKLLLFLVYSICELFFWVIDIIFYDVDINFYTPYFDELTSNQIMTPIQSIEILKENEENKQFQKFNILYS